MIRKLLTFVFIFIAHFAFCQNREAILHFNDGTSIEGLGMIKSPDFLLLFSVEDKILFRLTEEDEADEWTYEEVKGITFIGFEANVKLEYVKLSRLDKPELLELITDGNVNLYKKKKVDVYYSPGVNSTISLNDNGSITRTSGSFPTTNTIEKEIFYLKRAIDEFPTKIGDNYIKKSAAYFSDCELLVKKIKNHEFTLENLDQMVEYYNDICSE